MNNTLTFESKTAENSSNSTKKYSNRGDDVPLQVYKTRATKEEEDDDDEVCIANILKRSATTSRQQQTALTHSESLLATAPAKQEEEKNEKELLFAMQRAWAVLDNTDSTESTAVVATQPQQQQQIDTKRLKVLTTRIYIDDAKQHKVVQLTNLLTTAMVVQYLRKKQLLDSSDDWALFEIDNQHGVERPLREWEIVLDTLNMWDVDASNALLVKKYSYHSTLTSENLLSTIQHGMQGWLSIEYKKGKWQKRFCYVKDNAIHHAKDKSSTPSILCHLGTYDVYTRLPSLKPSPTPYVFAIRAQDKSSIFEREGDYMRCLAAEDADLMKDWVLNIRHAKSQIQHQYHPIRVMNPMTYLNMTTTPSSAAQQNNTPLIAAVATTATTTATTEEPTIRRHKSTRETSGLQKSESTRRLGRSNTTKQKPLINLDELTAVPVAEDNETPITFAKGSLLAKEETPDQILYRQRQHEEQQQQQSNTLIQIDDRIKFAKGSLLAQKENPTTVKMTRSKSVREVSTKATEDTSSSSARRHQSLKRRPTNKRNHDVPLPNTSPPPYSPPSNPTLLQLNGTRETSHSRDLHERHVKPLLNFDK